MKKTQISISKPDLGAAALGFATGGAQEALEANGEPKTAIDIPRKEKPATRPSKQVSGLVPLGDVRLTANISEQHHIKLKIAAAQNRTTIGELIEQMIDKSL